MLKFAGRLQRNIIALYEYSLYGEYMQAMTNLHLIVFYLSANLRCYNTPYRNIDLSLYRTISSGTVSFPVPIYIYVVWHLCLGKKVM